MKRFDLSRDGDQVQALVRSGFASLNHCRYQLLEISDRRLAARWIDKLLTAKLVKSAADMEQEARFSEVVQLAFTHRGLAAPSALALPIADEFPFPTIFARGMAAPESAKLLGDPPAVAWHWDDAAKHGGEVHLLVAHYRDSPVVDADLLDASKYAGHGLRLVKQIETCPFYIQKQVEPFGFADGISQPRVPGLHSERSKQVSEQTTMTRSTSRREIEEDQAQRDPNAVPAGELLLGQLNVYGEEAYCPDVTGFGAFAHKRRFAENGSYVAVRQIWQDTAELRRFDPQLETVGSDDPPTPFERMIGRRKGGAPILACPVAGDPEANDFLFRIDDYEGFHCPRGAHIRRGNPRDALGWDSASGVFASRLHRILRRGRVYRDARVCATEGQCDVAPARNCGKGLFFIALNADLERQFAFVQRQWLANLKFADLWQERDALGGGPFSMPGYMPVGNRLTVPQLTEVVGGGYFFLPSLCALKFIAGLGA